MKTQTLKEQLKKEVDKWMTTSSIHTEDNRETVKCFLEHLQREKFLEKALKQNTEQVIDAMLVEKRKRMEFSTGGYDLKEEEKQDIEDEGFNQCCTLQKENEKKLKQELCKTSKS